MKTLNQYTFMYSTTHNTVIGIVQEKIKIVSDCLEKAFKMAESKSNSNLIDGQTVYRIHSIDIEYGIGVAE